MSRMCIKSQMKNSFIKVIFKISKGKVKHLTIYVTNSKKNDLTKLCV